MRAILYCRVSTNEQAEHGVSLAAQESKLRAYCVALDIEVMRVDVDSGLSASTLHRAALQRALASLKSGEADAIIITKLDRISRSVVDLCSLVDDYFRDERHALISLAESIDTKSASGRLVLNLLGVVSQWEREAIGERTSTAMRYMRSEGRYTGGFVPFGYSLAADSQTLVEAPDEQAVIREARALRATGMSYRAIAATLAERGAHVRGKMGVSQVQRMLASAA